VPGYLEGKVVAITGAGRGIGRAHALALSDQGARVVCNDLGVAADGTAPVRGPADDVVAEITASGGLAVASHDDVSDESGARAIVDAALEHFDRLDAVVNNAGILRSGVIVRTSTEDWKKVIDVHLTGTFLVTKTAAEHWRARTKNGEDVDARVVNTSSSAGLWGFLGEPSYSAAKAGIVGFTLTAAAELSRYGVSVNAIAPGAATRLTAWSAAVANDAFSPALVSPLVVWLLGPHAAGVTGRVFEVGGGSISVLEGWRRGPSVEHDTETDAQSLGDRLRKALDASEAPIAPFIPPSAQG
jgi:NAD(P)-dependent dehydrogenase (short-subunit alcohol dehydrogenase family)